MTYCPRCDAELGVGRYCTNCGARLDIEQPDDPTRTAERPAVDMPPPGPTAPPPPYAAAPGPTVPPPTVPPPAGGGPRYPLFADEVPAGAAAATATAAFPTPPSVPPVPPAPAPFQAAPPPGGHRREQRGGFPWLVLLLVALLLAGLVGAWLALAGDGDGEDVRGADDTPTAGGSTSPGEPDDDGTPTPSAPAGTPVDLRPGVRIEAPPAGRSSVDADTGQPVSYGAGNMIDSNPTTAYRVDGDGAGKEITFRLPATSTITEVGLVNGYPKTFQDDAGQTRSWYDRQIRITKVEWVFPDGQTIPQELELTEQMQVLAMPGIKADWVKLRIVSTTPPAPGPYAKQVTSISEVTLKGSAS